MDDWSCHVHDAHGGMVPAQLKMRHETNTLTGTSEGSEPWVPAVARVLRDLGPGPLTSQMPAASHSVTMCDEPS